MFALERGREAGSAFGGVTARVPVAAQTGGQAQLDLGLRTAFEDGPKVGLLDIEPLQPAR